MEAFLYFGVEIFKMSVIFKGKAAMIGTFLCVRKETRVLSLESMLDEIKQVLLKGGMAAESSEGRRHLWRRRRSSLK